MDTQLLVSISGLSESALPRIADITGEFDRRDLPLTWLVRPRAVDRAPLLAEWVKDRARRGDAVLMHGYDHNVVPAHHVTLRGRRAEFAALPAHEARLRLTAAVAALERAGVSVDGFAPPSWLGSPGTLAALRGHGFRLCADSLGLHDLRAGELRRARVLSLPRGSARSEVLRCYALVQAVTLVARRSGLLRIALDADEIAHAGPRAALLESVDIALAAGALPDTYGRSALAVAG